MSVMRWPQRAVQTLALSACLVSGLGSAAQAKEFISEEWIKKYQEKMVSDPLKPDVVREKANRVVQRAAELSGGYAKVDPLEIEQSDIPYVYKYLALKLTAHTPQNTLKLGFYSQSRPDLFVKADQIGVWGSLDINGYALLKEELEKDIRYHHKPAADYFAEYEKDCNERVAHRRDEFDKLGESVGCAFVLSLGRTSDFKSFVHDLKPKLAGLKKQIDAFIASQSVGKDSEWVSRQFAGFQFKACDGRDLLALCPSSEPYLWIKVAVETYATGNAFIGLTVSENEIGIDAQLHMPRAPTVVVNLASSLFGWQIFGAKGIPTLDVMTYAALKEIELLDDNGIESSAKDIASLVRDIGEWQAKRAQERAQREQAPVAPATTDDNQPASVVP